MVQRSEPRLDDGSAGDADYGIIATRYHSYRRPDPHIEYRLHKALGTARSVINVALALDPTSRWTAT